MNKLQTNSWQQYLGQVVLYAIMVIFIGYFSSSPKYTRVPEGLATVKVNVKHSGQLLGECKILSEEELLRLPPNMRAAEVCPRERSAVEFQFIMDNKELYHTILQPTGLQKDGRANLYRRFTLPEGEHDITVKLKDSVTLDDFNYVSTKKVSIKSGSVLVVNFEADKGEFSFSI